MTDTISASSRDYDFSRSHLYPGTNAISSTLSASIMDPVAFKLYIKLKSIAKKYKLESKLQIPQLVIVGETSVGKSMLVQYFLRFPCSFSQAKIATRCPVAYCLRYNSQLNDGEIKITKPIGTTPQTLAQHLADYMKGIEMTDKFRLEPYTIELESNAYSDFEILDIPGLVGGDKDEHHRKALREAQQSLVNANGMRRIHELCTDDPANYDRSLEPRPDYLDHMVTIQTKFNLFMSENTNGKDANNLIETMKAEYEHKTYFTNMIFDGFTMSDRSFEENVEYIASLPELEKKRVNEWIMDLNRAATEQPRNYDFFNQENRPLIGIDIVRTKIQELWIKAIRSALPHLKKAIYEQLLDARQRRIVALNQLEQQDPQTVKKYYIDYINDFSHAFTSYINAKSESDIAFKYDKCSKTYADIESEYKQWKRRIPHTWRAYLSYNDMKHKFTNTEEYGEMSKTLDLRLAGARHFHRLEQVFKAMIYTCKLRKLSRGEIETAESHIAHSISTGENLEKAIRELVRSLIRDTFLIGICWLTQMYTFLSETLYKDVRKYFLHTANQYPQLKTHFRFLHCMELSYHRIVRKGIQESLQLIKLTRNATTSYITHDITAIIKKLAFSIPAEIKHKECNQSNIKMMAFNNDQDVQENRQKITTDSFGNLSPIKIQNHLYASESYLTSDRNPQTANHHNHGRNVILEMYSAVRGQLIYTIIAAFNTNLIIKLHEYNTIQPDIKSLHGRLMRMSDQQIAKMADVKFDEIRKKLDDIEEEIIDLRKVLINIETIMKPPNSVGNISADTSDSPSYNLKELDDAMKEQFQKERNIMEKKLAKLQTADNETTMSKEEGNANDGDAKGEYEDYETQLIESRSELQASQIVKNIYEKEDSQDMEAAFLKGDSLDADADADELEPKAQRHLGLLTDRASYDTVVLPEASLPHSLPPQSETRALQSFSRSSASIEATSLSSDQNQKPLTNQTIASLSSQPDAQHQHL
ncbi:unnamed protein product [Adineta steineri]|uniref:Dynamin N-terminal domain-containing protein n=1 Tax=Adineta steineri TaxID=433720 RepID=A0A815JT77_9BILA|nr:unnamed protein product [Adineta steineri]CAF3845860.1 unnamed protein product [Adineta steineri]